MNKEPINKRKIQAAKTKVKIFEAAVNLINEHGINKVSVDSIVQAAGVSKGTFYLHYESKDALLIDLVNRSTNMADNEYKSYLMVLSDSKASNDIFISLIEKIADYIENNIGLENMSTLYKSLLTKTVDTTSAINYSRELYTLFTEVIEKGVSNGELRDDISVDVLVKHVILAIRGVVFEWCIRYPDFDLKEQLLSHFKIIFNGMLK